MTSRRTRAARRARLTAQGLHPYLFPQWLRTTLVVLIWLGLMPVYIRLVSPFATYPSARTMGIGLAVFSGLAPHLWATRTAPYRTVLWALLLSVLTGATLLPLGADRFALTATTVVGFTVVALRVNQHGRKLVELVRTWRALR